MREIPYTFTDDNSTLKHVNKVIFKDPIPYFNSDKNERNFFGYKGLKNNAECKEESTRTLKKGN
jgi:hypothetical protein